MTNEELVKRLRDKHCCESPNCNCEEAADRIEALTKERDDYAHKLMQANNTYTEMHLDIERLSDKLAKAVEFAEIVEKCGHGALWDLSRTTLAEIKGESHE